MSQNIIQQSIEDPVRLSKNLPEFLDLNFRGRPMSIPRDTLINFPETILADMFPDGCLQEYVDMDYACIEYLMTFYHNHSSFLVLREALEYYCIPLTSDGNMIKYKKEAGKYLQAQNVVFDPLFMKNDQHLINMLCYTGFNKNDIWGYRQLEANHTNLLSLRSLVLSKGIAQKLQMLYKRAAVNKAHLLQWLFNSDEVFFYFIRESVGGMVSQYKNINYGQDIHGHWNWFK